MCSKWVLLFNTFSSLMNHINTTDVISDIDINETQESTVIEHTNNESAQHFKSNESFSHNTTKYSIKSLEFNLTNVYNVMNDLGLPEHIISKIFFGEKNVTKNAIYIISNIQIFC